MIAVNRKKTKISRLLAGLSLALLLVTSFASPAKAATIEASGVKLKFDEGAQVVDVIQQTSGSAGKAPNDIVVYRNVATINGFVIDAVIDTVAVTSATVSNFDGGGAVSDNEVFETDLTTTNAGSVTLKFSFYEGGTYTGVNTGTPVTLKNVSINSYDLDSSQNGNNQYTQFSGFQSYTLSSNTTLSVSNPSGNLVQFINNSSGASYSTSSGSYTKGRVMVVYDYLSSITIKHGTDNAGSGGGNFYGLEFGVGVAWTEGSTTISTASTTNSFNVPPTASDDTLNVAPQDNHILSRFDFGNYADADNNPWASLKITTLPTGGSLEYLNGSTWQTVTLNQVISHSDLELGKLRYTSSSGTASDAIGFKVGDGLAFSTAAYNLVITVRQTPQTITFANPNAKAPSLTFASAATASSGLTVTLISNSTGICTVSGLDITTVAAGTCSITAIQPGDSTWGAAQPVTQDFPVSTKTAQVITFSNPGSKSQSTTFASGATADSGLTVTLTSLTPSICSVSGLNITTLTTAGTCQIRASQAGDATRAPASNVTQSFLVNGAALTAQTITYSQPADQLLSGTSLTVSPTATSNLTVTLTSSTQGICTVSGFVITFVAAGTCTTIASQSGNSTYSAATSVTRSFAITSPSSNSSSNTSSGGGTGPAGPTVGPASGTTLAMQPRTLNPEVRSSGVPTLCLINSATGVCGNALTVPNVGRWTLNSNGSVTFVPAKDFIGTASAVLRATDQYGLVDDEPMSVTVLAPGTGGDIPTGDSGKSKTTNNKTPTTLDVLASDTGSKCLVEPNTSLCATAPVVIPKEGTWEVLANGKVKFTPTGTFVGVSNAQFRIASVGGLITTVPLSVTVTKRPPVTVTIGNFTDGSPIISNQIASRIRAFVNQYSNYRTIECVGFTEGPTVLKTDAWLSKQRATNSCNYVTTVLRKKLGLYALRNKQDLIVSSGMRRVTITLRD
jgi:CshA-type fibril repeat protein